MIVGHSAPKGYRQHIGGLMAYYADDGRLIYGDRVNTGMSEADPKRLHKSFNRFGSKGPHSMCYRANEPICAPLYLTQVNWARPELVCGADGLLRQVIYEGG